jgi:ribonucleoside-triphosphate reductase
MDVINYNNSSAAAAPKVDMLKEISKFVFTSKYARYNEDLQRRETWEEAVERLRDMHLRRFQHLDPEHKKEINWAFDLVTKKFVVPSMRSLQFGGAAVEAHNARLYNCSVTHVHSLHSFAEIFYLLLCGCGVGLGIYDRFLKNLPELITSYKNVEEVYTISDNIEGWADSLEILLLSFHKGNIYSGKTISFDYSKIRDAGTKLKTSGGRAPGSAGLRQTHQQIAILLQSLVARRQTRLRTLDAYDVLMHTADAVLSGGVRRAATSVVFDKNDTLMMNAKINFDAELCPDWFGSDYKLKKLENGNYLCRISYMDGGDMKQSEMVEIDEWTYNNLLSEGKIFWKIVEPQRARSNNSVLLLRNEVTEDEFKQIVERTKQWGEPGFVFADHPDTLYNPCFEISFIPITDDGRFGVQFCNLTSINGTKVTTPEIFADCIKAATIIGTLQAAYTDFKYLAKESKELTEQESLLGVSITAMMDNPHILLNAEMQKEGARHAVQVNKEWSQLLGINQAARVTCVKPEGTSTLVLESMASGIHPAHSKTMFRRIQMNKLDPVYQFFKQFNPHLCEESVWSATKSDDVITFPVKLADSILVKSDLTALKHLDFIKTTQENWVGNGSTVNNHKPLTANVSCTVVCRDEEWTPVIKYLYENRQNFAAVSLIGYSSDKDYQQTPNEEVKTENDLRTFEAFNRMYKPVDYTQFIETDDLTKVMDTQACAGGVCEISFG